MNSFLSSWKTFATISLVLSSHALKVAASDEDLPKLMPPPEGSIVVDGEYIFVLDEDVIDVEGEMNELLNAESDTLAGKSSKRMAKGGKSHGKSAKSTYEPTLYPTPSPTMSMSMSMDFLPTLYPTPSPTLAGKSSKRMAKGGKSSGKSAKSTYEPTLYPTPSPTMSMSMDFLPTLYPTPSPTLAGKSSKTMAKGGKSSGKSAKSTYEPTLYPTPSPTMSMSMSMDFLPTLYPTPSPTLAGKSSKRMAKGGKRHGKSAKSTYELI